MKKENKETLKQQKKNKGNITEKWLKGNRYKFRKVTGSKCVLVETLMSARRSRF